MIGALITFLVLFGLIKIFERDRDDLDNFNIAVVAIVPALTAVLVSFVFGMLQISLLLSSVALFIIMVGVTLGLLWKNLGIPLKRSIVYTIVVVLVNESLAWFLLGRG